jgi:hypothetical protein
MRWNRCGACSSWSPSKARAGAPAWAKASVFAEAEAERGRRRRCHGAGGEPRQGRTNSHPGPRANDQSRGDPGWVSFVGRFAAESSCTWPSWEHSRDRGDSPNRSIPLQPSRRCSNSERSSSRSSDGRSDDARPPRRRLRVQVELDTVLEGAISLPIDDAERSAASPTSHGADAPGVLH